jgi:hypothetical protein
VLLLPNRCRIFTHKSSENPGDLMPRIGVYSAWENDLLDFCHEYYPLVTNRMLMHDIIMNPVHEIRLEYQENKSHPYILRERLRKWERLVHECIDIPLPTWEQVIDEDFWDHGECPVCHAAFSDGPEWILFGEASDFVYPILDDLANSLLHEGTVAELLKRVPNPLLNEEGEPTELLLFDMEDGVIYVLQSPAVEHCNAITMGTEAVIGPCGDAASPGEELTYVFSDETIEEISTWIAETREAAS